ncbi:phage tail tube protein [Actinoplanes sp. NPDC051470]|uniref:phage tail tube protein n=1 Tax=Actinoplanes sp. NPDC051470 TaxID=3157224 RepID=UPI00342A19E9
MATVHDSYIGVAEESIYGTAVAPARFLEMASEGIAGKNERIESEGWRAGQKVLRRDRFEPNPKGAEGDVKLEVLDGSLGLLLKHCLGSVASGAPSGGFTTHTFTVGDLKGKSLTVQVGRGDVSGAVLPFTYEGGKVTGFEITSAVDGVLGLNLDMDFAKETIGAGAGAYALSVPTYAAGTQLYTFVSASVTVAGTQFGVSDISVKGDNALKTDRYYSGTAGRKKEPLTEGLRKYEFELKGEFDGLVHANRAAAAVAASNLAEIVAVWSTPQGGEFRVVMPFARFDEAPPNFDGAQIIEQSLKGMALEDGTASPITIAYKTKDTAP